MRSILLRALICVIVPFAAMADGIRFYPSIDTRLRYMNQNQAFRSELPAVPLEARPVFISSLQNLPKLARVIFITDNERPVMEFDYAGLCGGLGYGVSASSCEEGMAGNSCPYTAEFVDVCLTPEEWCNNNNYGVAADSCTLPAYPTEECPKSSNHFQKCEEDKPRACGEAGYALTCETGKILDAGTSCPYDANYKTCVCDPCEGFDYTAEEANAQGYEPFGPVCNSCGEIKYMRQAADCGDYVECDCGGIGTACWSGSKKMFASCQSCYTPCASGQLDRNYYWCDGALKCFLPAIN